jgi:hypothetical protein
MSSTCWLARLSLSAFALSGSATVDHFLESCSLQKPDCDFMSARRHRYVQRFVSRNEARAIDIDANYAVRTGDPSFCLQQADLSAQPRGRTADTENEWDWRPTSAMTKS